LDKLSVAVDSAQRIFAKIFNKHILNGRKYKKERNIIRRKNGKRERFGEITYSDLIQAIFDQLIHLTWNEVNNNW
jgi:hypothetical protein